MRTSYRRLALALAVPAVALAAAGCDTYNEPYRDTYGNVIHVATFSFDVRDAVVSADGHTATFASDDVRDQTARRLIAEVLDEADVTANGVVLLYAEDDLFLGTASGGITRWAALPYTEGFESVDIAGRPYVDLTLSYTYSYDAGDPATRDDGNLYFDVNSSAADVDFGQFLRDRLGGGTSIRMKFVAIPATIYSQSGLRAADLRSFETVARTFDLAVE